MNTRRQFLIRAPLGVLGVAAACRGDEQKPAFSQTTPGAPTTFNTSPAVGPEVSPATFAEAEKLAQVTMTDAERAMAAASWRTSMAAMLERRTGPRKVALEDGLAPATRGTRCSPAQAAGPPRDRFVRSHGDPGPLPASDEDIAFAPVTRLSRWIETRKLTSERLTTIYLDRIRALRSEAPLRHHAHRATRRSRRRRRPTRRSPRASIAARCTASRGACKDLLDTAGIPTTYGAEPFRNRVPTADSAVVTRLARRRRRARREAQPRRARAQRHLVRRPDDESVAARGRRVGLERGPRRGHRRGPGRLLHRQRNRRQHRQRRAMRCGVTGLRPTYGRVPRTGAMTLCWSLDKLGPMTRIVEDAMLVLQAITGPGRRRRRERAEPARLRRDGAGEGAARRLLRRRG